MRMNLEGTILLRKAQYGFDVLQHNFVEHER